MSEANGQKWWITYIGNADGLDNGREEVNEDNETHREATEPAKAIKEDEFRQIVNRRIDPSPTLRKQDGPLIGCNGFCMRIAYEVRFVIGEMLEKQGRQISILAKMQKVLHMQGVDAVLRVILDHLFGDDEWFVGVRRSQSIHRETTR